MLGQEQYVAKGAVQPASQVAISKSVGQTLSAEEMTRVMVDFLKQPAQAKSPIGHLDQL